MSLWMEECKQNEWILKYIMSSKISFVIKMHTWSGKFQVKHNHTLLFGHLWQIIQKYPYKMKITMSRSLSVWILTILLLVHF